MTLMVLVVLMQLYKYFPAANHSVGLFSSSVVHSISGTSSLFTVLYLLILYKSNEPHTAVLDLSVVQRTFGAC